jgi:hypothetical protein
MQTSPVTMSNPITISASGFLAARFAGRSTGSHLIGGRRVTG